MFEYAGAIDFACPSGFAYLRSNFAIYIQMKEQFCICIDSNSWSFSHSSMHGNRSVGVIRIK